MKHMKEQNSTNALFPSWRDIVGFISAENPTSKKKLRIKLVDTIFLNVSSTDLSLRIETKTTCTNYKSKQSLIKIIDWVFTSKNGEPSKRKNLSSLTLQHVNDRLSRFALANPANATGPRIVAIGKSCRGKNKNETGSKLHFTAEQFQREVKKCEAFDGMKPKGIKKNENGVLGIPLMAKIDEIQCYLRPYNGIDQIFRGSFNCEGIYKSNRGQKKSKDEVGHSTNEMIDKINSEQTTCSVFLLKGGVASGEDGYCDCSLVKKEEDPFLETIRKEVEGHVFAIVNHLQEFIPSYYGYNITSTPIQNGEVTGPTKDSALHKILTLDVDFILDDNKELWMIKTTNLKIHLDEDILDTKQVGDSDIHLGTSAQQNSNIDRTFESFPRINFLPINNKECPRSFELKNEEGNVSKEKDSLMSGLTSFVEVDWSPRKNANKSITNLSRNDHETIETLREKIRRIEAALLNERGQAAKLLLDANSAKKETKELSLKLIQSRNKATQDLNQKNDEHTRSMLDLNSKLNASRSEVTRLQSIVTKRNDCTCDKEGTSKNTLLDLLEKINNMQREFVLEQRKWGEEKRSMTSSHAAAEQAQAANHREHLSEQRSIIASLEDQIAKEKEFHRVLEKENMVLTQKEAISRQKNDSFREQSEKLSCDLELTRQALSASQNAHNFAENIDENSTKSLYLSTADQSQFRLLNNKVEYLKAQLANEIAAKDECFSRINELQKSKEELVLSQRLRIRQLDEMKDDEIKNLRRKIRDSSERPVKEISELQGHISKLKSQLSDSLKCATDAKKNEENTRATLSKEIERGEVLDGELKRIRLELEESQNLMMRLKEESSNTIEHESILRRMDNECKYLKSQLESTLSEKNEVVARLNAVEKQLQELKVVKSDELEFEKKQSNEKTNSLSNTVSELRGSNQILDAEVKLQRSQIQELAEEYTKVRDLLRIEQSSSEQIRASSYRMAEELKATQEELTHAKRITDESNIRYNENAKAIKDSIKKVDDLRTKEMLNMQEEMRNALSETSKAQNQMICLQNEKENLSKKNNYLKAGYYVTAILSQKLTSIKFRIYSKWRMQVGEKVLKEKTIAFTNTAVDNAKKEIEKHWKKTLDKATEKMNKEKNTIIDETELKVIQERKALSIIAKADTEKAIEEGRSHLLTLMKEKEVTWIKREKELNLMHQKAISRITMENNKNIELNLQQYQRKIEKAKLDVDLLLKEQREKIIDEERQKQEKIIDELRDIFEKEKNRAIKDMKSDWKEKWNEQRNDLQREKNEFIRENESKWRIVVDDVVKKERMTIQTKIDAAVQESDETWKQRLNISHSAHEEYTVAMKQRHEEILRAKIKDVEKKNEEVQNSIKTTMEEEKSKALELMLKEEKNKNKSALDLEVTKWQEILRKAEEKSVLEYEKHRMSGAEDRDRYWQEEMKQLKDSAEEALSKAKSAAREKLKYALEQQSLQIEEVKKRAEEDKVTAVKDAIHSAEISSKKLLQKKEAELECIFEERRRDYACKTSLDVENAVAKAVEDEKVKILKLETQVNDIKSQHLMDSQRLETELVNEKRRIDSEITRIKKEESINLERHYRIQKEKMEAQCIERLENMKQGQAREQEVMRNRFLEEADEKIKNAAIGHKATTEAALESLEKEYEERMHSLEYGLSWEKKQREEAEKAMGVLRLKHENSQRLIDEHESIIEFTKRESSFNLLKIMSKILYQNNSSRRMADTLREEAKRKLKEETDKKESMINSYEEKLNGLTNHLNHFKDREKTIYDVMLNNKRDVLLQHKMKSRDVSSYLEKIIINRKDLEDKRIIADNDMKQMEDRVYQVEKKIQEHSQTSAIQEGRINISHARQKRRLDEEYEHLLENIDSQRQKISKIDSQIKIVLRDKEEQDNRMRELEQELVKILVGQQKQLISIISTDKCSKSSIKK